MKDQAFGVIPIWIQSHGDYFLLIQHRAGHWGFPKGHAEPGETAIVTARREFEEETSIREYQLFETAFIEQYSFIRKNKRIEKIVTYFPALVETATVICQPEEIRDYAFLLYDEALKRLTFEPSKRILIQVNHYLQHQIQQQIQS